jgi:hypothetical protein
MLAAAGWVPLNDSETKRAKLPQTPKREGALNTHGIQPPLALLHLYASPFWFWEQATVLCSTCGERRNAKYLCCVYVSTREFTIVSKRTFPRVAYELNNTCVVKERQHSKSSIAPYSLMAQSLPVIRPSQLATDNQQHMCCIVIKVRPGDTGH